MLCIPPDAALGHEMGMLNRVAAGESPFLWALWATERALVLPWRARHHPNMVRATVSLAQLGWRCYFRHTGGGAVPQGQGIINLSLAFRLPEGGVEGAGSIAWSYNALCGMLREGLAACGVNASVGEVEGAVCNGRYNIVIDGKKFAGTAQRRRRAQGGGEAVLVHATLWCDNAIAHSVQAVNVYNQAMAIPERAEIDSHTNLSLAVGPTNYKVAYVDFARALLAVLKSWRSREELRLIGAAP